MSTMSCSQCKKVSKKYEVFTSLTLRLQEAEYLTCKYQIIDPNLSVPSVIKVGQCKRSTKKFIELIKQLEPDLNCEMFILKDGRLSRPPNDITIITNSENLFFCKKDLKHGQQKHGRSNGSLKIDVSFVFFR